MLIADYVRLNFIQLILYLDLVNSIKMAELDLICAYYVMCEEREPLLSSASQTQNRNCGQSETATVPLVFIARNFGEFLAQF